MWELLWLLLPLAAASGWLAARLEQKRRPQRPEYDLPSAYFKGLNFLLNEQPDKAIEVFTEVLQVDSDTVETHVALGNLFRRRGEVERAIRIHQNLIARPSLDKHHRLQALFELGQDYLKAGLFDRAENLFLELAEVQPHSEQALRQLVRIYQQEKEWEKAIAASQRLARISSKDMDEVIAQYYCELADQAATDNDIPAVRNMLKRALTADHHCVRATMLAARLAARQGNHREAIREWKRIEEQDARYLGDVVGEMADSYRALDDEAGLNEFLRGALKRHGGVPLMLAAAAAIERCDGTRMAQKFVVEHLRRQPSVHGLYRLIELNLAAASDTARADLELLLSMIGKLREQEQGYVCRECGFTGKVLHWQCPGCKRWNTVKPVLGGGGG